MTRAVLLKAFTRNPDEGNPAAVVFDDLAEARMPGAARSLGFSTTAFVKTRDDGDIFIRFFSPRQESGLCIHALIAAAHLILPADSITPRPFRTRAGQVEVRRTADGLLDVTLPAAQFGARLEDTAALAAALRVDTEAFSSEPIEVVSTGKPKILIPFRKLDGLLAMNPDPDLVRDICRSKAAEGIFAFSRETRDAKADFHARHFNPITLADEDPICGVGSGALAAYLRRHGSLPDPRLRIEMGYTTNLPGTVFVEIGSLIKVGGFAVEFGERLIEASD